MLHIHLYHDDYNNLDYLEALLVISKSEWYTEGPGFKSQLDPDFQLITTYCGTHQRTCILQAVTQERLAFVVVSIIMYMNTCKYIFQPFRVKVDTCICIGQVIARTL